VNVGRRVAEPSMNTAPTRLRRCPTRSGTSSLGTVTQGVGSRRGLSVRRRSAPGSGEPGPAQPPDVADGPSHHVEVPEATAAVIHALPGAALVAAADGSVVLATAPAVALRLVRHGRLQVEELLDVVRAVAGDGAPRDATVEAGWRGRIRPDGAGRSLAARARVLPVDGDRQMVLLLVEDRTEALRVEAARQDFVVNVSHELKTPVGAISLLAEAMQAAADDPEAVTRFARRMQSESERLATLVGEIVELSRLQLHDPVERAVPLQVAELVVAAFDRSRVDADTKGIELVSHVPHGVVVTGNRNDLVSALGNLVANALAYSPSQSRVTVTAAPAQPSRSPDGRPAVPPAPATGTTTPGTTLASAPGGETPDMVDIAVADQGIGIPADKLDRIFERFFRLDEARSRATGGTGLGLAIVKHIATGHGGSVRVWSVRGAGSTFTLRLPVRASGAVRLVVADEDGPVAPGGDRGPRVRAGGGAR